MTTSIVIPTIETIGDVDEERLCSKTTHFYEFKEYTLCVNLIDELPSNSVDLRRRERAHQQFKFVCDSYQEQPHLVDPYLASIYEKLIGVVKKAMSEE